MHSSIAPKQTEKNGALKRALCRILGVVSWFTWGYGLDSAEDAESGIGHTISLLGIVLAGTISLGVAIHSTGRERLGYLGFYGAAGFMVLAAMTSILRGSAGTTCETVRRIWRGEGRDVKHIYSRHTIGFTRCTLLSSAVLIVVGLWLAYLGRFPGQELQKRVFAVKNVRAPNPDEEKDIGAGSVVAEIPINKDLYRDGIPSNLRLRVTIAAGLAKKWGLLQEFSLWWRSSPSAEFKAAVPGVYFVDTGNLDSQCADLPELDRGKNYCFCVYLTPKAGGDAAGNRETKLNETRRRDFEIVRKQIMDECKLTVVEDVFP